MDFDDISAAYCVARKQVTDIQLELDSLMAKADTLRHDTRDAELELERLLDLEQSDHVRRILDGDKSAPKRPKRLTRIANLKEQIAGAKLAMPVHQRRIEECQTKLAEARQEAGEKIIPAILDRKIALFQSCAEPLEALIASLAEVAAMDNVQRHFANSDGSIVLSDALNKNSLFSAQAVLRKFRQTLPERFRDLASQSLLNIDQAVEEKSRKIIQQIGG